ncbi:MAG: radical SAM protein, partial [Coprobacillus cateniformis]
MQTIPAKTILSKNKYANVWFGNDYNMNLYRGCHHGCIYCDSRSECYQNDEFDIVKKKEKALDILSLELMKKRQKGVVGIGAMSDSYNQYEKKEEITRGALQLIRDYRFGVSLETKSDLVVRDIDLFLEIQKYNDVIVKMTITTYDDTLSKIIEPHVCVSSKRFAAIKKMSQAGLFTGILMGPVLPFINDTEDNVIQMVRLAHLHEAKFIHAYFGVTLRDRQRDYYYEKLDEFFPGLKEKYMKYYGSRYNCNSLKASHLWRVFQRECKKYGLLYKMDDIIKAYKT